MTIFAGYTLIATRSIAGSETLRIFQKGAAVVATVSGLGAVYLSNWQECCALDPEATFFSKIGRNVTCHLKVAGGGSSSSKTKNTRSPEDASRVNQFVQSGGTSTSASSNFLANEQSSAIALSLNFETLVRARNVSQLAKNCEALIRNSLTLETQTEDPFLVIQYITKALASDEATGLPIEIKQKFAEALHRYVDLTVYTYSMEKKQKVLVTTKQDIDAKLLKALSLHQEQPEANEFCYHLQASLAGIDTLRDTDTMVINSLIQMATALGTRNVGIAINLLQNTVSRKVRASRAEWYLDSAVLRLMQIDGLIDRSISSLDEFKRALEGHQDWQFLFGGILILADLVKSGKTESIRKMAFDALVSFASFDEFKFQNNWRIRLATLDALIKLFGQVDDEINELIKNQLVTREAVETDARVRSLFGKMEKTKELQKAWEELLDGEAYERLIKAERNRLNSYLGQFAENSPQWWEAKVEIDERVDALTSRQKALEKGHQELAAKVGKLEDRQLQTDKKVSDIQQLLASRNAIYDMTLPPHLQVPLKTAAFVERAELSTRILKHFSSTTLDVRKLVLYGEKGAGKSTLVNNYLYGKKEYYGHILWAQGNNIPQAIRDYVMKLDIGIKENDPLEKVVAAFKTYLGDRNRWLVVFNGVKSEKDVEAYIPPVCGDVIIITETPIIGGIEVPRMTEEEASNLFMKLTGSRDDTTSRKELAKRFHYNPQVITFAAHFIRQKSSFYMEFLSDFDKKRGNRAVTTAEESLGIVFELLLDHFKEHHLVVSLLYRAACFSPVNIPKNFLEPPGLSTGDQLLSNRAILALGNRGMGILTSSQQGLSFLMPELLQKVIRKSMSTELQKQVLGELFAILKTQWKFSGKDPSTWPGSRFEAPNVEALCDFAEGKGFNDLVKSLRKDLVLLKTL